MLLEIIVVCLFARWRGYKLSRIFSAAAVYPVLLVQAVAIAAEFSLFFRVDWFYFLLPYLEGASILSFLPAILIYRLYPAAMGGSACVLAGTALNRFVISQNGGKMPVFPSLSYLTGYVTPDMLDSLDTLHTLGDAGAKYRFLSEVIDYGYCILSVGDLLIHFFFCLLFYALIREVCRDAAAESGKES